jgi:cytochrome c-type biogenesis protein
VEQNITVWLALIAGLVSFISPCVLPLVPAYIGYMGGRVTHNVSQTPRAFNQRFNTFLHGVAFVGGFTFIFVALGLLANAFVNVIGGYSISTITGLIGRLGGVLIIFFGIHFMGLLPGLFNRILQNKALSQNPLFSLAFAIAGTALIFWGFSETPFIWDSFLWEVAAWAPLVGLVVTGAFWVWLLVGGAFTDPRIFWNRTFNTVQTLLYMDTRPEMSVSEQQGFSSSAVMGIVFAAGWTPCIGPVYGAVLTMAATPGSNIAQAGMLLVAYSLGLGIPFLITALMLDSAQNVLRRLNRHMKTIKLFSGAFLVLIGVLVASNQLQRLSQQLSIGEFGEFSINMETAVLNLFTGEGETAETLPTPIPAPATPEEAENALSGLTLINPETGQAPPISGGIEIPQDSAAINLEALLEDANDSPREIAQAIPVIGLNVGDLAPDFETLTDTGAPIRLSDMRGQVVLLNFWATWCPPCEKEMPEFEQAFTNHQAEGFTILAVNNGETVAKVQEFRAEYALSFPLIMDQQALINRQYGIRNYPSTFIIDRDGRIIFRTFGELTAEQIQAQITDALQQG